MLLTLLFILLILAVVGAFSGGTYRNGGIGLGGLILVVLLFLFLTGNL